MTTDPHRQHTIPLSAEAARRLRLVFAPRDREVAWHLLTEQLGANLGFPAELGPEAYDRLRFAAMKASRGTLAGLQWALAMGTKDWRDLLVEADFADDVTQHLQWLADGSAESHAAAARWERPDPLRGSALPHLPGIVLHKREDAVDSLEFSVHGVPPLQFVEALLTALRPGEVVVLPDPDDDCGRYVRRAGSAWQTKRICHGRFMDPWHDATRAQAVAWLLLPADRMVNNRHCRGWIDLDDD